MLPILSAVLPLLGSVLDRVIPDRAAAEKAKLEMSGKAFEEHGLDRALGKPEAATAR